VGRMIERLEPWWGNDQINQAHYFAAVTASRRGSKSACGEIFHLTGLNPPWTQIDPQTSVPWKKCEACMCAMRTAELTSDGAELLAAVGAVLEEGGGGAELEALRRAYEATRGPR